VKLPQRRRHETRQKLRLADQQDLEMPCATLTVVREKAKLLQGFIAQGLSFVDDDCDPFFRSELLENPFKLSQ